MARIFQTGFEYPGAGTAVSAGTFGGTQVIASGSVSSLGIPVISSGNPVYKLPAGYAGAITTHKSVNSLGGSSVLVPFGINTVTSLGSFSAPISEGYIGFAFKSVNTSIGYKVAIKNSTGNIIFYVVHTGGMFQIHSSVGTSIASYTSATDASVWSWISVDFKVHPTDGYVKVYVNSVLGSSTPTVQITNYAFGATIGAYKASIIDFICQTASSNAHYIDDLVVNSKSISFISSSGTPVVGNTITGATSGATAIVDYIEMSDSTYGIALSGRLTVSGITGTFADVEGIGNGSGWTSVIQLAGGGEAGLDFNSSKPGETYVIGLSLSADRSVDMTGSDGNNINNYALLNEQIADDTTFVEAIGVSTAMDLYELEDVIQNASVISAISVNTRLKKSGDINTAIPAINLNGATQYSPSALDISTNISYKKKHSILDVNQVTNDPFSKQEVNDLAIGIRFK